MIMYSAIDRSTNWKLYNYICELRYTQNKEYILLVDYYVLIILVGIFFWIYRHVEFLIVITSKTAPLRLIDSHSCWTWFLRFGSDFSSHLHPTYISVKF